MKHKFLTLFAVLSIGLFSYGMKIQHFETKVPAITNVFEGYSNWLYLQGDKALQYRFKQLKEEDGVGYFEVQFRIDFENSCNSAICEGYLAVFGYPTLDNQKNINSYYKFYYTFKDIYTLPEQIPIKLNFDDGSKRILTPYGFIYTLEDGGEQYPATFFGNCVDDILQNQPNEHRCKPYQPEFKDAEAVVLK